MPVDFISNSSSLSSSQSAILLQEVGALYITLKAASGGATFAQFACQRVLPALGLLAHEIEGIPAAVPSLRSHALTLAPSSCACAARRRSESDWSGHCCHFARSKDSFITCAVENIRISKQASKRIFYCPTQMPQAQLERGQSCTALLHQTAASSARTARLRELFLFCGGCSSGCSSRCVFAAQRGVQRSAVQLIGIVNLMKR